MYCGKCISDKMQHSNIYFIFKFFILTILNFFLFFAVNQHKDHIMSWDKFVKEISKDVEC
jgi:hypothetical protein